ncbi:hypothetical protein WICPIJ_000617 [Wickerhamomyces pijperi]|uniref:PH domain-containing protein n=1 Tax=Wickerhamomyces pijperi TaxID=599730 RepID=A0A9P8QGH8_WICPI|nr:hypothetical protein WICPIJ_000617 [Wickerhamomyces pijperi]
MTAVKSQAKTLKAIEAVLDKYINHKGTVSHPVVQSSHNTNAPSPLGMATVTNGYGKAGTVTPPPSATLPTIHTSATSTPSTPSTPSTTTSLLEEDISSQLAGDLKTFINICPDNDEANLSYATKLLSQVVSKTRPPNDCLIDIVDEELLLKVLGCLSAASSTETVNSVLRLLTFFIRGWVFSKGMDKDRYLIPVLNALSESGYKLLYVMTAKIQGPVPGAGNAAIHIENNLELVLKSINFVTSFLGVNHLKLGSLSNLLEFMLNLQKNEFLLSLINVYRIDESRFQKYVHQPMLQLRETLINNYNMLNAVFVKDHLEMPFIENLIVEIVEDLTSSNNLINAKESSIYIRENFSLLQLIDLFFFLKNTNISFKKQFHEQLIFHTSESDQDEIFPLVVASSKITNVILHIPSDDSLRGLFKIFILKDMLYYHLIVKMAEVWNDSESTLGDLYKLCSLLDILIALINEDVVKVLEAGTFTLDKFVAMFKKVEYAHIREAELQQVKDGLKDSLAVQTSEFDVLLKEQVFEFIRNQRIIQLSKGFWCYSSISTSVEDNHDSSAFKYYFMILSANRKQLLYQEFPTKPETNPNIDKSGEAINVSSINKIHAHLVHQTSRDKTVTHNMDPNSRLVNLLERPNINKVAFLNRKGTPLLTVYDNVADATLWMDGLKLLKKDYDSVSDELRKQSLELFDVRKGIQLISVETAVKKPHGEEPVETELEEEIVSDLDDGFYDLDELQEISSGFYYT